MGLALFCGEWHLQSWDVDGLKMDVKRSCLNIDLLSAIQIHLVNGELNLIVTFTWQNENSPTFILKGADARRFLNTYRVQVPVDWVQGTAIAPAPNLVNSGDYALSVG